MAHNFKQKALNLEFDNCSDLPEQLLIYIKNKHRIATIELLNSGYDNVVGFIKSINEEYCIISSVNEYGFADSHAVIRKKDITRISFDSEAEIEIEILFAKNQ